MNRLKGAFLQAAHRLRLALVPALILSLLLALPAEARNRQDEQWQEERQPVRQSQAPGARYRDDSRRDERGYERRRDDRTWDDSRNDRSRNDRGVGNRGRDDRSRYDDRRDEYQPRFDARQDERRRVDPRREDERQDLRRMNNRSYERRYEDRLDNRDSDDRRNGNRDYDSRSYDNRYDSRNRSDVGRGGYPRDDYDPRYDRQRDDPYGGSRPRVDSAAAARAVERATGGRVLSVDQIERNGRFTYRVKVLLREGRIRTMSVDGQTGSVGG